MLDVSTWDIVALANTLLLYISGAFSLGGLSIVLMTSKPLSFRRYLLRYAGLSAAVLSVSAVMSFVVQVGAYADNGLRGLWDPDFTAILWDSPIGQQALTRSLSSLFFLLTTGLLWRETTVPSLTSLPVRFRDLTLTGALLLYGYSFHQTGHTVDLPDIAVLLIMVHVIAISWWLGSLYPLWRSCHMLEQTSLHDLMTRFGQLAAWAVGLLMLSGGYLLFLLLASAAELIQTNYGNMLLTKLIFVTGLLSLAALNKWRLTPLLANGQGHLALARSIKMELALGLFIFLTTTILTTWLSPANMAA
ncbi:MAG: CopD family protein [Gammaproteobacteria bacterium]|nr:CopD family protein [Gammaproteobacteria bacterium]